MPHEIMDTAQVARYLHMDQRKVHKLASRGKLPCQKRREGYVFRKIEIDHWVEGHIHTLAPERLAQIESGVVSHHGLETEGLFLGKMIPAGGLAVPLTSRTAGSVIRDLLDLADKSDLIYSRDELLSEIRQREDLCSTAMLPGIAMPHPRHHAPYDIAESFVVAGRCDKGIPYGAPDGSLTRLFFLICCKDDRTHLHVLARLSQILHSSETRENLLTVEDEEEFRSILHWSERLVVS